MSDLFKCRGLGYDQGGRSSLHFILTCVEDCIEPKKKERESLRWSFLLGTSSTLVQEFTDLVGKMGKIDDQVLVPLQNSIVILCQGGLPNEKGITQVCQSNLNCLLKEYMIGMNVKSTFRL